MPFPDALSNVVDAPTGSETLGGSTPSHTVHTQALVDAVNETQAATLYRARADEVVFDAVAYGAAVDGSTDDTAAWQAAFDACAAAGGGVVTSSLPGVSVIAGALQDTSGANAQLTLPQVDYADAEAVVIVLCGPQPPAVVPSVIGATPAPDNHLVLKSTLTSGTGALLGGYGPVGTTANFTNVHLVLEDIGFRMASNPTNSALDLRRVANLSARRVTVDAGSFNVDGMTEQTTATSFGVRLPGNNNGAHVHVREVDVVGFYNGVEFSEHANLDDVNVWGCKVGFVPAAANHASVAGRIMAVHCQTGIKPTGAHAFDVAQFDIEHAASGWTVTTYDVDDASNYLSGMVRWWAVLAGVGAHDSFTVNGGANLTESRVGEALGGGGGSTTYFYRDQLTATAGDNTLTLGAVPVANSPLVWVDGALVWPVTDYAISSDVITFGAPLAGGEVVAVHYASEASTAAASTISHESAVVAADTFNRSNSSVLGTTDTGSKAWTAYLGTWGVTSNLAVLQAGDNSVYTCHIDAAVADATVSVTIKAPGGGSPYRYYGLWVRTDGAGNGYLVQINGEANTIDVVKRTGGSNTSVISAAAYTPADGDVISVAMSGNSIVVKVNGVTKLTGSDSTYATQTRHGLWAYGTGVVAFDDFSVTA